MAKKAFCLQCRCYVSYRTIKGYKTYEYKGIKYKTKYKEDVCKICGEPLGLPKTWDYNVKHGHKAMKRELKRNGII